jgi:hypothetical protein
MKQTYVLGKSARRLKLLLTAAVASLAFGMAQAHADVRQCREAKATGEAAVTGYYNPRVGQIDEMAAKGVKLTDVKVKVPRADGQEQWMTLAELKDRLMAERVRAAAEVSQAIGDCEQGFKPYQDVMNTFVLFATGGLSKLLPERVTRIDVSDILAGYPLGGPDAFIPKLREQILGGDRGTISNIIRDPWKCITFQRKC